jgi:hypothetical protein
MTFRKIFTTALLFGGLLLAGWLLAVWAGVFGRYEAVGTITGPALPTHQIELRAQGYLAPTADTSAAGTSRQILWGDLHVHSTYSGDAFLWSLPILRGDGAHPPADACDFARYCSGIDFWSINDHAESLTPRRWQDTRAAIEQCNAVAADPTNPDLVSFLGWEWTQVGNTPQTHYGHKNVILLGTTEEEVPSRPIAAGGTTYQSFRNSNSALARMALPLLDLPNRQRAYDFDRYTRDTVTVPECPPGNVRDLPADCIEHADTPGELFARLDEWNFPALVIPHGTSWGSTAPPGASWDQQLPNGQHDPRRQNLVEVYSGHGNSEEYRDWRGVEFDQTGKPLCPPKREGYTPNCQRAGEIIQQRCLQDSATNEECDRRATLARQTYVEARRDGIETVPGQRIIDWLDAGQCRDCFLPAFDYRPGMSAQYALAVRDFTDTPTGAGFRFGLMASSDNHSARPGTGYKEVLRELMTDQRSLASAEIGALAESLRSKPEARSQPLPERTTQGAGGAERMASFWLSGGLVAVHAENRSREAIWSALQQREVYGTSGPRILLWFNLLNGPGQQRLPMGSAVNMSDSPTFRVTAVGARRQLPGCPHTSENTLGAQRLQALCRGECYHPADQRELIARIEIIRIQPQQYAGEPLADLVEDPWRSFDCVPDENGCEIEFSDPEHPQGGRDSVYYARAVQQASPAINAASLGCELDAAGQCLKVNPCPGGYQTDPMDNCLAPAEERAWSSPLFIDFPEN